VSKIFSAPNLTVIFCRFRNKVREADRLTTALAAVSFSPNSGLKSSCFVVGKYGTSLAALRAGLLYCCSGHK